MVLKHMLGAKLRVITGFTGIKDIGLALERGEVQAACALALSTAKAAFDGNVKRGELKFLVQFGKAGRGLFRRRAEFLQDAEDRRAAPDRRPVLRPVRNRPSADRPARHAARDRRRAAQGDGGQRSPTRHSWPRPPRAGIDIEFVSGEETAQSFADFYKTPPAVLAKAREIMGRD